MNRQLGERERERERETDIHKDTRNRERERERERIIRNVRHAVKRTATDNHEKGPPMGERMGEREEERARECGEQKTSEEFLGILLICCSPP